ncbi:a139bd2e-de1d-451e-afce-76f43ecff7ff [Sclerotinia trifoliorum]|uniref:A139bd2e-de1d-451e-afce-76f43ecff7ff n=1 Tax=Sclerotinia trifoliorum TaxID=28548 RepID=A0A8H2ZTY7_9HELO|nr:a139bd2e-de1d-451e-afce-76f43ecff7ff [Sclerotinia trifoliorum]
MYSKLRIPLLLTVAATARSQFVKAPTDLTTTTGYLDLQVRYKEVPSGICESQEGVKSLSGYVDIEEGQHIFWWFFETRNGNASEAPLTVWINGGPGSSSMIGLFEENGPCSIDADGNVVNNPYSWNNVSNMLYIDQPAQVGLSYSIPVNGYVDPSSGLIVTLPDATCPDYAQNWRCGTYSYANESLTVNSTDAGAPGFWKTLQGFMGAFPEYSRNGFHFATESYGGHYGPIYNEYIETQNAKNISGALQISLESVLIGNGWYDPLIQYQAYYNFTVSPGNTYDYSPFNATVEAELYNNLYGAGNCVDQIKDCAARGINEICAAADNFCANLVEVIYDTYSRRDELDVRELTPDPFPYSYYASYLNTPEVQAAIGAFQNYSASSNAVGTAFRSTGDDNREAGTIEAVRALLTQGVYVAMMAGDADYNCNWLGGEVVSQEVNAPNFSKAGYTNISTSDSVVHGQVKQSGLFSFSRIYESGHEVPFYQPLAALEIFQRVIGRVDIETGLISIDANKNYLTVGTEKSTYREGNKTVQFEVLPADSTYNTTLNGPNPVESGKREGKRELRKMALGRDGGDMVKRRFKFGGGR